MINIIRVALGFILTACTVHQPHSPLLSEPLLATLPFRDPFQNGGLGPEMAWIPSGAFLMGDLQDNGSKEEKPVHRVTIPAPFAMGRYEVTFEEFDHFCISTGRIKPHDRGWGRGRYPVINVDWFAAIAYTEWLSEQTGKHYRLPTEAEWEYSARAETRTNYWWGNEMGPDHANCYNCGEIGKQRRTSLVGSFTPNLWGLYDTAGNVFEWTASRWAFPYQGHELKALDKHEVTVVANYLDATQIVMRGGAWNLHPLDSRVSYRYYGAPQASNINLGFRVARSQ